MAEFNQWHIEEIQLDLDSNTQGAIPIVYGRQGDRDGVLCNIELTQQGVPVQQSWFTGKRVYFESRGNGVSVRKQADGIEDGVVKVVLPEAVFSNIGLVRDNFLRIEDSSTGNTIISGTSGFQVYVRRGDLDPNASDYYLEEIENIVDNIDEWVTVLKRLLEQYANEGQAQFDIWFKSVKEVLYGIDPGGNILRELIEARTDDSGFNFPNLKTRLDNFERNTNEQLAETAKKAKAELVRLQERPLGLVHRNSAIFETDFDRRPLISFVSDDGCIEDYTVFKPLFESYDWKFTLAIQTAYMGMTDKYNKPIMTWEQLREMYNEGYTVCSHTVNHEKLAEISPEQADYELRESREVLLDKGFDVRHIMYPNGSVNETVYNLSKKYYLSGGTIANGENTTNTRRERINRYSVLNNSITTLKAAVDLAVANNTWIVFYIHGFEVTDYPTFLPKLQELMAYINTSGVKVLPYDDGYDMFVRKAPLDETHRVPHIRYTMTENQNIPRTSSADILMPSFGWNSSDFADYFSKDTANNRFVIKKPGLYLVEYTLLIEAEAGSQVTVSLASGGANHQGTTLAKVEKQQSFLQGGTNNVSGGTLKAIPVSGQFVVHFNPDTYKEVHVYLNAIFRGQSGNATNKILSYQDTSHLSITQLSM